MDKQKIIVLILTIVLVLLPGIYAVMPLLGTRFIPTHDGEYHIIRFNEFQTMLNAGNFFPRWAPSLNSGFGIPLFNFHYPFPNYAGVAFHSLGWSLADSLKLSEAVAYLLAVVLCYFWLQKLFSSGPAIAGTILFSYIPYWFVDIYVRGSVGELWAIAWFFSMLVSIEYNRKQLFPFLLFLLIISHNILAFFYLLFVIIYGWVRSKLWPKEYILGILLAGYFWIPAILEQKFVMGLNSVNYQDHFSELFQLLVPSWGTGFSKEGVMYDELSFQIGLASLAVIFLGFVLQRNEKDRMYKKLTVVFTIIFIVVAFLMLHISGFIWKLVPMLQLIQYPWRFLSVIMPISAYFSAYCVYRYRSNKFFIVGTVIVSILCSIPYVRPVTYEPRSDSYYLSKREFTDGTSSIGNSFSTIWTPWKQMRVAQKIEVAEGNVQVIKQEHTPMRYSADVVAMKESTLRINTVYYPGWTVYVDGVKKAIDYDSGIISFTILPSSHHVSIVFEETLLRKFANWTSVFSLFWISIMAILKQYDRSYRNKSFV